MVPKVIRFALAAAAVLAGLSVARAVDPVPLRPVELRLDTGVLNVPAGSISLSDPAFTGTLPDARLSAYVLRLDASSNLALPGELDVGGTMYLGQHAFYLDGSYVGSFIAWDAAGNATFKTINGNSFTGGPGTWSITAGNTFTSLDTLTLAGTDGSTLNVGNGGTLGSAAFTNLPAAPTITITGSTATITHPDATAKIYYTTDGTTPTGASTLYTGAISLTGGTTVTVKAVAYVAPASGPASTTAAIPDADVSAYTSNVATAGGTMTSARQTAISTFITSSKAHGTWAHLLDVWAPATDAFTGALVKVKAYTGTGSSVTNTGFVAGDYTPATGLLGASGKSLDTGFNYATYGSSVAGYSFYAMDDYANVGGAGLGYITGTGGGISGDLRNLYQNFSANLCYTGRNQYIYFGGNAVSRNLIHLERSSLTNAVFYINGVSVGTDTGTMTSAPQNLTARIFGAISSTTPLTISPYTGHGGFFAIDDGGMTATQAANFYADVKALMTALGRSPKSTAQARFALTTGQSLGVGSNSTATLSITQPYTNRQVSVALGGGTGTPNPHYALTLPPLVEGLQVAGAYESIGAGMANQQASLWRVDHAGDATRDLIVSNAAVGSTTIATRTSKAAGSIYNVSLQEISDAMAVAPDYYSGGFKVAGINQVDGESDATSSTFAADLLTLWNQYQTDIQALTGQTGAIPMLYSQISAWTAVGNIDAATAVSPIQQLAAYEANPTKLVLVGPKYIFTYGTSPNDVHLTSAGYRWLGEYYGKVWDAVVNRGGTWSPLRPTNITRSGATITVTMTSGTGTSGVAGGSLVLDTTTVSSPNGAADGFEWNQTGGTAQTISSVSVSGATVTITLTGDPGTGSTNRLRYAYTGTAGNAGGPTSGPRGCLRDSDAAVGSSDGNNLYNWCVTFDKSCP